MVRVIIIALYALGAVITGAVVKSDFYSLRAPYKRLFLFGTLLLVLGLALHVYCPVAHYFYYCMALFCGMQSALGCKVKNSVLRTCYMSGTATDIGAAIGKVLKLGPTKAHLRPIQLLVPCLSKLCDYPHIDSSCCICLVYLSVVFSVSRLIFYAHGECMYITIHTDNLYHLLVVSFRSVLYFWCLRRQAAVPRAWQV